MFIKTFKGYEDRVHDLDHQVNSWVQSHGGAVEVVDVKSVLSHEVEGRARSGDLIYTVLYRASAPFE